MTNKDDEIEKSFEDWWNNDLDDIEREEYNMAMKEYEESGVND